MQSENTNIQRYKWTPKGMVPSHEGIWYPMQKALQLLLEKSKLEKRLTLYEVKYGKLK